MNISKVKIAGTKGLKVSYLKYEENGGLTFLNEHQTTYRMPVHQGLKDLFAKFTKHLIKICGLAVIDSDVEVTAVTSNGDNFLISGMVTVLNGQVYAINTPLIKEEAEYSEHKNVLTLVDELYKEVKLYCDKKRKIEPKQFVMDFYKNKEGFDQSEFDKMSDGDTRKMMIEALEKTGAIIIDKEDIEVDDNQGKVIEMQPVSEEKKKKVAVN